MRLVARDCPASCKTDLTPVYMQAYAGIYAGMVNQMCNSRKPERIKGFASAAMCFQFVTGTGGYCVGSSGR